MSFMTKMGEIGKRINKDFFKRLGFIIVIFLIFFMALDWFFPNLFDDDSAGNNFEVTYPTGQYTSRSSSKECFDYPLGKGSIGRDVHFLQFIVGAPQDGVFGKLTIKHLLKWKIQVGLLNSQGKPNEIVDAQAREYLNRVVCNGENRETYYTRIEVSKLVLSSEQKVKKTRSKKISQPKEKHKSKKNCQPKIKVCQSSKLVMRRHNCANGNILFSRDTKALEHIDACWPYRRSGLNHARALLQSGESVWVVSR